MKKIPKIYDYMNDRILEAIASGKNKGKWKNISLQFSSEYKEINVNVLKSLISCLFHIRKDKQEEILKELEDCDIIEIYFDGRERRAKLKKWQKKKEVR